MYLISFAGTRTALGSSLMSIDNRTTQRESDLERWYSGYLIVKDLSEDVGQRLADLAKDVPGFDVSSGAIELEYRGRDKSQIVVRTLLRIARLIRNADGEIRCQVSGDVDQLWFEFYRIREGRLFRQHAEVVRQPELEVTDLTQ